MLLGEHRIYSSVVGFGLGMQSSFNYLCCSLSEVVEGFDLEFYQSIVEQFGLVW